MSGSNPFPNGVPRFCVSIEIFDNDTQNSLIEEGFNTDSIQVIDDLLDEIKQKLQLRESETTFGTVGSVKRCNLTASNGKQ